MGELSNSRHEVFAQEIAKGSSASAAFVTAGYAKNDGNAARLKGNERVAARIAELMAAGTARAVAEIGITQERVLRELSKLAFFDVRKAVTWRSNLTEVAEDPDTGLPVLRAFNDVALVDSAELDDETAGAIVEVSQGKDGSLKIKFADKRASLVDIGKHLGMFVEKTEANVTVHSDVTDKPLSDDEWTAAAGAGITH